MGKDFFLLRLESAFIFCRGEKFWPSFENSAERVLLQSVSFFPRVFVWGSGLPKKRFFTFRQKCEKTGFWRPTKAWLVFIFYFWLRCSKKNILIIFWGWIG